MSKETSCDRLRALLHRANLTQKAAARVLEFPERTFRYLCADASIKPPAYLYFALEHLAAREDLHQQKRRGNL